VTLEVSCKGDISRTMTSALAPCSHEEADSRIFVHVKDMAQQEHMKVMICIVDTEAWQA